MRVISGKYRGRNLSGFTINGTRPTQDRVKESIFAMIQNHLIDATVLDLFAGSGNLGIEALSNGANHTYFVDHSKEAYQTIKQNLDTLKISNATVFHMDYRKALEYFQTNNIKFDIVFLDPPYKDLILEKILQTLYEKQLLHSNALIICEYETEHMKEAYDSLKLIKYKKYGSKYVKVYRK